MKNPLISIIVPIYRVEKYISKCLDSILSQTYKNLEIILVNDGSDDDSISIAKYYAKKDNRIVIIEEDNKGLSCARNNGINSSNGEYITFVDSDDYIEKDYIEKLYNGIKKYKVDIAIGGHNTIYSNGKIKEKYSNNEYVIDSKEALEKLLYVDDIDSFAWSKLYKKSLFDEIKFPRCRLFEDIATTYKLIDSVDKVCVVSYPIYNYVIREGSITTDEFSNKKMDLIVSAIEMTHYLKNKYKDLAKACDAYLMYAHLETIKLLASSKHKYKKEQKELVYYIRKHYIDYIKDKRVNNKNKIDVLIVTLSFNLYKLIYKLTKK